MTTHFVDGLAVEVEQRQLAARLREATAQVKNLGKRRKIAFQLVVIERQRIE